MLRRRARHGDADRARLTVRALLAAALAALALSACGGGEDEGGATTATPVEPTARERYLARVDPICASFAAQIEAAGDKLFAGGRDPSLEAQRRFVESTAVPLLREQVEAIEAIGPPPGDEAEIEAILDATREGIAEVERSPELLIDGRSPALDRASRLAARYGSEECGL